jgi:mannosyl-oligosaccharide alpha-1,2-mannosidase
LSYISGEGEAQSTSSWSLFGSSSKSKTNWDARAQSVREAFQLSWAGYEKYAWGMCFSYGCCCVIAAAALLTCVG